MMIEKVLIKNSRENTDVCKISANCRISATAKSLYMPFFY